MASNDSRGRILAYLLESQDLRKDLKAQATRVLQRSRHNSYQAESVLKPSFDLIPRLLQKEVEVLAPLIAPCNRSLSASRSPVGVRKPSLPVPKRPVTRLCTKHRTKQSQSPPAEKEKKKAGKLPSTKLFRLDLVLQRVYQPRKKELSMLTDKKQVSRKANSPLRIKKSEALLVPVLESQARRVRNSQSSSKIVEEISKTGSEARLQR